MGKKNNHNNNKLLSNKLSSEKSLNIDSNIDLDWIDDYQKEEEKKKIQNKKNTKKSKNKNILQNIKNYEKKETIIIQTNKLESNSGSDSGSDSEFNPELDQESKSKKINTVNKFDFIVNSESDSYSENESDKSNKSDKSDKKSEIKIKLDFELDNGSKSNDNIVQTNKSELKIEKVIFDNKIIIDNLSNKINSNNTNVNLDSNSNSNSNIKVNKKMRQEQHSQKKNKNKYNFDLVSTTSLNPNNNLNKLVPSQTNSIITLYSEKVEVYVGGKKLLGESDIVINAGTKYFVLGSNGIGKTSLLKQIYLQLESKLDILMIDQDIQIESTTQTISEFILGADPVLYTSKKRMDQLEKLNELNQTQSDEYSKLSEIVYSKEWDKYEAESQRIINGLGFTNSDIPVSILSGGKRMILAIGKALLRKPDILMLDEPTNHLDLDVVIWLTNYLSTYKKTLIIITHQIGLANSLGDVIWYVGNPELTGNKVYTIRGNYDKLIKFLDQTEKETSKNYEKFTKKVEELRKKSTPKKDVDEFIKNSSIPRPPKPYVVNMEFDDVVELSTKNIIEFRDVGFGYPDSELIYTNLNISLGMGSRMILVGPNGCGKTTFFKLINKTIKPSDGYVLADDRLRVGYYNQQIVDNLPLHLNPIQYLQELNPKLDQNQSRTILGKLGIKKLDQIDLPTTKISDLSGGQKARVSFASVQMANPHLILLDEPTNHLDLESIEGLIKGINGFNGGIVIITHDMYLIESIERARIYQVKLSNIIKFPGEFEDYCEMVYSSGQH
jgi:ATP-binding cassette subfamily F protein 1